MKILTPAKINLTLEVIRRRADGYHDLATWMLSVGLYDTLEVEAAERQSFTSNVPELKNDSSNLVVRAAQLFNHTIEIPTSYNIRLEKKIPLGAGLGGGSSNAAATLLILNELHGYPLSSGSLGELAAALGSDVAFFIEGGSAWCTSRGEVMEPREFQRDLWIFLVKPGFGVSSASAYKAYAALPENKRRGQEIRTKWGNLRNDLEPAVFPKYLLLPVIKEWLTAQSQAVVSLMSGSGSTIFAIINSRSEGEALREAFARVFGERIWASLCALNPGPGSITHS
jgi:4-diphosphocytidyl-2-C-methyl-D-erythritol kinase